MADQTKAPTKGQDAEKAQERKRHPESAPEHTGAPAAEAISFAGLLGDSAMDLPVERHAALVGDPRFSAPVNAVQRAAILSELQRGYGNAYVQRVMERIPIKKNDKPAEEKLGTQAGTSLLGQEDAHIQRAPTEAVPQVDSETEAAIDAARASGESLPDNVREPMEQSFGADFSSVRVHTDSEADKISQSLQSKAFTTGQDIFFRQEEYNPGSTAGRELLAHELTHTIQQGGASAQLAQTRPKTSPSKLTITHETKLAAPDGSAKTRNDIGVGEEVTFKGSAAGMWTASRGSPKKLAKGGTFTWTAPNRKGTVKIRLKVGRRVASVKVKVIEPNSITATKNSEIAYPGGTQGAGMKLTFNYHPKNVSFGNLEAKEVSHAASAIKGYYLLHGMPHWHDTGDTFFAIGENNKDTAEDTAASSGYPAPWSAGSFEWKIPNHFKVKTEGGDGKKFTTVTQAFSMIDASGKTKITKAGAEVERSP